VHEDDAGVTLTLDHHRPRAHHGALVLLEIWAASSRVARVSHHGERFPCIERPYSPEKKAPRGLWSTSPSEGRGGSVAVVMVVVGSACARRLEGAPGLAVSAT
jgi:hypothetical protein